MSQINLTSLPVELFEKILEDLEISDILRLKLLDRQAYQVICCSEHIKYRVELFLAGFEDGNHYSLAERQQFLRTYQSNWDSLVPQKTTNIPILHHRIYELAGGIYGFVPDSTPNSVRFYRLPSVSRGIEMEEWSVQDLDFPIDDFTMEEAYDLLTIFIYKTGHVKVHLLQLSDGKPHPRARKPLLEYEIPLNHTVHGWELEAVIWENKLGCLFTSTSANESVDALVVWDWTTGDLIRVLPQCGNHSFTFLNGNTVVAGRSTEDKRPSLAFIDLGSDGNPLISSRTLVFPNAERGVLWSLRLNLGIPIRHGPELKLRVPFVVNHSQQILFITAIFTDSSSRSLAVPLWVLWSLAQAKTPLVEWKDSEYYSVPVVPGHPHRACFTMGSRFVAFIEPELPFAADSDTAIALVYDLSPRRLMRVGWDSSMPHCEGIPGTWNTVMPTDDDGGFYRAIRLPGNLPSDVLLTEDSLVVIKRGFYHGSEPFLTVFSF